MSFALPPLPDRGLIADLCRETAANEGVQPALVEKDFYLTRLLWALGAHHGEGLLLKGGTLLSKVDLGFYRMSEDADLVLPGAPSRFKRSNATRLNQVRDGLRQLAPLIGVRLRYPSPELFGRGTHGVWDLDYDSEFGPQGIRLEVSIRPALLPPRRVALSQLLRDPLAGNHRSAFCWALAADEVRAEKVRAACTREAVRDFYDLEQFAVRRADFTSDAFLALVDAKLEELNQPPLRTLQAAFGVNPERRRSLEAAVARDLPGVLRADAPTFDLDSMLRRFERMWHSR